MREDVKEHENAHHGEIINHYYLGSQVNDNHKPYSEISQLATLIPLDYSQQIHMMPPKPRRLHYLCLVSNNKPHLHHSAKNIKMK